MYIYIYMYICIYTYIQTHTYIHTRTQANTHTLPYIHFDTHVHRYADRYAKDAYAWYTHFYMYMRTRAHTHTHTHEHTHLLTHTHTRVCYTKIRKTHSHIHLWHANSKTHAHIRSLFANPQISLSGIDRRSSVDVKYLFLTYTDLKTVVSTRYVDQNIRWLNMRIWKHWLLTSDFDLEIRRRNQSVLPNEIGGHVFLLPELYLFLKFLYIGQHSYKRKLHFDQASAISIAGVDHTFLCILM